jgi:hypothetical protein
MGASQQELFMRSWKIFLENIENLGKWKIQQRGGPFVEELQPLFADVMAKLLSNEGGVAIGQAVASQDEDDDEREMLVYLAHEMHFFDRLVTSLKLEAEQPDDGSGVGEALGTAKTIKESIEKWLKKRLSKRWTNVLTILNELLSILKGG